jgi:hypothetical protein
MKLTCIARKLNEDEETGAVWVSNCILLWRDIVGMEDDCNRSFRHPTPLTWLWTSCGEGCCVEGSLSNWHLAWIEYLAAYETPLTFTRN